MNILNNIEKSFHKDIFWKIYLFLMIFEYISSCVLSGCDNWKFISFVFYILILVAFYCVVCNKKIFNRLFWKIIFILSVIWKINSFTVFIISQNKNNLWSQLSNSFLIMFFVGFIVLALPRFIALYLYAFKSDKIWGVRKIE